jgi:hypothetical protein
MEKAKTRAPVTREIEGNIGMEWQVLNLPDDFAGSSGLTQSKIVIVAL